MKYRLTFKTDDGEIFKDVLTNEGNNFTKLIQDAAHTLKRLHNVDLDKTYLSDYEEVH